MKNSPFVAAIVSLKYQSEVNDSATITRSIPKMIHRGM